MIRKEKIAGHSKPFHDLRHTFATDLFLAGVPILKVSRWLGHASIQITCDTYGHLSPDPAEHGVVDALDQLILRTPGHQLVTRGEDEEFGRMDDHPNYANPEGDMWHAGRAARSGFAGWCSPAKLGREPPSLGFEA